MLERVVYRIETWPKSLEEKALIKISDSNFEVGKRQKALCDNMKDILMGACGQSQLHHRVDEDKGETFFILEGRVSRKGQDMLYQMVGKKHQGCFKSLEELEPNAPELEVLKPNAPAPL
jgi:hypothetical protein